MKISDLLIQAQAAVDEAKISEDLRQVAFQQSVELLSRQAGLLATPKALAGTAGNGSAANVGEGAVEKIERKVDLPQALITEVYAEDGQDGVDVVVGVGKLDSSTAAATKQLALLICGARQLAELEQWTSSKEIRKLCVHYGRFDPANFAKTLRTMDESFSFKGKGQQLEVRLHQRGIERLKELLASLTEVN